MENINRIKAVLADSGKTGKWLAEQLGKDPVPVSKWCTNTTCLLAQEEVQIDLTANHAKLSQIEADIQEAKSQLNVYLKELGLESI